MMREHRLSWLLGTLSVSAFLTSLFGTSMFGCQTASSTPDGEEGGQGPGVGGGDGSTDGGGCTPSQSVQAARAALAAGATTVFADCAKTMRYTRTLAADGGLATEEIDNTVRGDKAVWDFTQATKTYRWYPSAAATVAAHAMDVTLGSADDAGVDAGPDADAGADADASPSSTVSPATFVSTDDTDGDNIPDERATWVVDPSSATIPLTVETDPTENGSWSTVYTSTEPTQQPSLTVQTSGPNSCGSNAAALATAFTEAINEGTDCLTGLDSDLGSQFYEFMMNDSDITLSCNPTTGTGLCGQADLTGAVTHWFPWLSGPNQLSVTVWPGGFDPAACGDLSSTLFHEMLHFLLGRTAWATGSRIPAIVSINASDRVSGHSRPRTRSRARPAWAQKRATPVATTTPRGAATPDSQPGAMPPTRANGTPTKRPALPSARSVSMISPGTVCRPQGRARSTITTVADAMRVGRGNAPHR